MISKWAGIAMSALVLSGCSTFQKYYVPPQGVIDDSNAPDRVIFGERDYQKSKTIAGAFLKSYSVAYDASFNSMPARQQDLVDQSPPALEMTRLGMTVIEVRCDAFFESIGRGSQRLSFFRRQIEILSTALTTVLGLSGAKDAVVAAAGIGSGVSLSTLANFESTYYFAPDIGKVQHLVDDSLDAMREALLAPGIAPRDFESAIRALKKYQTVCTAHEIKRLVNEAVDKGRVKAVSAAPTVDPLAVATATIMDNLSKRLKAPVQLRDIALMKWIIEDTPSTDQLDFICPSFTTSDLGNKLCSGDLGKRSVNSSVTNDKTAIANAIATIGQLQPDLLDKTLETWKAAEKSASMSIAKARSDASVAGSAANATAKSAANVEAIQAALDAAPRADIATSTNSASQLQPSLTVVPNTAP